MRTYKIFQRGASDNVSKQKWPIFYCFNEKTCWFSSKLIAIID